MNILDCVLIAVLIGFMINGYMKGFFKKIFQILGIVFGLILFKILYPIVNKLLLGSFIFEKTKTFVIENMQLNTFVDNTKQGIINSIQQLEIPDIVKNILIQNDNIFNTQNITEYISSFVSSIIINLVIVVLVFLLTIVCMRILAKTTNLLSRLPVLSFFDRIGGIIVGFIIGVIVVWLLCTIILVLSIFPQFEYLRNQINGVVVPLVIDNDWLNVLNSLFNIKLN